MKHLSFKMKKLCTAICAVSLIAVLPGKAISKGDNGKIMVSLGDSYSSGEGIPPFYGQEKDLTDKIKDHDWLAHRSQKSWPGRLVLDGKKMKDVREKKNWYFVASSGATTEHIKGRQEKKASKVLGRLYFGFGYHDLHGHTMYDYIHSDKLDPQIKVFSDNDLYGKVDYVTMTLGGNDAEFSNVVIQGIVDRTEHLNIGNVSNKLNEVWNNFYADGGIRDKLRQAYKDIAAAAGSQAKIIVVGYPKLLHPKSSEGFIPVFPANSVSKINDSVSRFNDEIESLVNSCKVEGMKICFVSVEEEFDKDGGHGAYADEEYINEAILIPQDEDLTQTPPSAYSIHPNGDDDVKSGAAAYARCVQAKLDELEKDGGKKEWPEMTGSDIQDVALVLDASGSMNGTPLDETKTAAIRFAETTMHEDVGIGVVIYDNSAQVISGFIQSEEYLDKVIKSINSGGSTNIEDGLKKARDMFEDSHAQKKYIILMSDGEPNEGKVGEELIEYADSLKEEGFRIYTLGFFSSLSSKAAAQSLMERMANDACHYEVDDASQLVFFFNDISEQLRGTKYYYIRIACPVDVTVTCDGETLSSKDAESSRRTSFGTMTFEENPNEADSSDNRIKTLRLKEGENYDIKIEGNGEGSMSYTIGFMDENGEYSDMRRFEGIEINRSTKIDTMAAYSDSTILKVDNNGDGSYDTVYKAEKNGTGVKYDHRPILNLLLAPVWILLALVAVLMFAGFIKSKKRKFGMI